MKIRLIGLLSGAFVGVLLGGGTGIVGAFGGVAGVYVFATLGALVGFFASNDISNFLKRLFGKN